MPASAFASIASIRVTAPPPVIYIPEVHSFMDGQRYFPELRKGDCTKATIVADIAGAHHEDIKRIIAVDIANGKCWDASKEIAEDVLAALRVDHEEIPCWIRDFLEEHLGTAFVNLAEREWTEAA